jgi:hypothetical protein
MTTSDGEECKHFIQTSAAVDALEIDVRNGVARCFGPNLFNLNAGYVIYQKNIIMPVQKFP